MKKQFQKIFSDQMTVDYWDNIYDQQDFNGDCYRQRMGTVLSWIDKMNLSKDSNIFDAGCGAGRISQEIANRGYKVFGMDFSYNMAIKANRICKNEGNLIASFLQGDIESLPFKNSCFDVIVCVGVVAYLKSEREALCELARILKPGGILAISIVNKARLANRLDLPVLVVTFVKKASNFISSFWKKRHETNNADALNTFFIPQFRNSLELAGFNVLENRTVPWKIMTLFGKEILPRHMAEKTTLFFERFSNLPIVVSFGGMCIFKAERNSTT